jgi:hypothetical protein
MKAWIAIVTLALCSMAEAGTLRAKVEGAEAVDELVKNLKKQASERGHTIEIVFDGSHDLRLFGISEESLGGAQGTIVVLNWSVRQGASRSAEEGVKNASS